MSDHVYLSTGCLHGEHAYCQKNTGLAGAKTPAQCKFCKTLCVCPCHQEKNDVDLPVREVAREMAPEVQGVPEAASWLTRDIISPVSEAEHGAVRRAQRALKLTPTGDMDEPTRASLRGVQSLFKLPVTGVLDRATAQALDRLAKTYPEDS